MARRGLLRSPIATANIARRGLALGVAAVAELLTGPAADVAALAVRLGATPRAVSAALRLASIAPLVVRDDLGDAGGELRAAAGATSATLPRRQRLALAPIVAPRARRRGRATPAARASRSSPSPSPRAPGLLVAIATATERLWRRAHLTYDETREVAKRVRARLELHPPAERRGPPERLGQVNTGRLVAAAYRAARVRGGDARARGLLVKTLLLTGARVAEFVSYRVEDLLVEECQIRIRRGKGGKDRTVPLLPEHAHELQTHIGDRRSGWLFETWSARPYSTRRVQQIVREVARSAGIVQRVSPHLLRHEIAQHLLDRGMPLDQVQQFLGHEDIRTTQVYARASASTTGASYRRALGGGVSASWAGAGADLGEPSPAPPPRLARGAGGAARDAADRLARPRGKEARPGPRRRGARAPARAGRAARGRSS